MKKIITYPMYTNAILEMASASSLIALDLDDVVFTPDHNYACGSVWYERYHAANKHLLTPHKLMDVVYKCLNSTKYAPVSSQLNEDFSTLSQNQLVIGLTARTSLFSSETQAHLTSVNMAFSQGVTHDLIIEGIIYAGHDTTTARPNNKGEILSNLLEQGIFGKPTNILFIDDSLKNLQDVFAALPDDISFTGIHFTAIAAKLLCDYESYELHVIGNHQLDQLNEHGYIPSNDEVWGDMCITNR